MPGSTAKHHLATNVRVVAAAILPFVLPACGEAAAVFRGTVTAGDVSQAKLDAAPNPEHREPIAGAQVFVTIRKERFYEACQVPAGVRSRAQSDEDGVFDTGVIGWGYSGGDNSVQVCFTKAGFKPHELVIREDPKPDERNGEKYWNVTLEQSR